MARKPTGGGPPKKPAQRKSTRDSGKAKPVRSGAKSKSTRGEAADLPAEKAAGVRTGKTPGPAPRSAAKSAPAGEAPKPAVAKRAASPREGKPAGKSGRTLPAFWPLTASRKIVEGLRKLRSDTSASVRDVVRQIEAGPKGPHVIAAFDFDGTLLGGYSGVMLYRERMRRKEVQRAEVVENITVTFKAMAKLVESSELITKGLSQWAGKTVAEMEELGEHLFESKIQDSLFPEMREILEAHRRAGHTVVVATAATRFQAENAVRSLGIDHLLCTELEVAPDGKLTGALAGESLFGVGKVNAIKRFVAERGAKLANTHFYGDGDEEIGLMQAVGYPHPVNPSRKLAEAARKKGWRVLKLQSRGGGKPRQYARSIGGMMTILPILQAGLAVGALTRDRRAMANLIMPTWIQAQLDMAKVKLRVSGRKNLTARRPAIFIFNHRNMYDGAFALALVRTDVAAIGKKEIGQNIVGKATAAIMPTVYVERGTGDAKKAAEALQPVIDAIGEGYSVMLAPEGTRVRGHLDSVGPFKKGAFHMAMAAGVPVVPIVVRNALDVASRDGPLRPGTVDIAVLPPVSTDDWTRENMTERIERVRQSFIDTLNHWPAPDEE